MQAIRLNSTGDLRLVNMAVPDPAPGEVLVRVEAAGICGTDRHLFKGEFPATPGTVLGHEFTGIVVGRGSGVDIPEGARVTCDPNIWCGTCDECRRGRVNLCRNNVAVGINRDGGFAEYCAFPAHKAHVLPQGLDPRFGAFCEPLACTLHGLDIGAVRPGERVLVIGGGVIGLLAVQLARLAGGDVVLLTRNEAKRRLARTLGAAHALPAREALSSHWPDGADLVIECAGVAETVAMAPKLARRGGRVVVLGVLAGGEQVPIEPFDLLFREVNLLFAFINPFTQAHAVALIGSGQVQVEPLISREISLADATGVISAAAPAGEIRCLVRPGYSRA